MLTSCHVCSSSVLSYIDPCSPIYVDAHDTHNHGESDHSFSALCDMEPNTDMKCTVCPMSPSGIEESNIRCIGCSPSFPYEHVLEAIMLPVWLRVAALCSYVGAGTRQEV